MEKEKLSKLAKANLLVGLENRIWTLRTIAFQQYTKEQKKEAKKIKDILSRLVYEMANIYNQK
jgi:hypothetical protein